MGFLTLSMNDKPKGDRFATTKYNNSRSKHVSVKESNETSDSFRIKP